MRRLAIIYVKRKLRSEELNAINDLFSTAYHNVLIAKDNPIIIEYEDDQDYKVEDILEGIMSEIVVDMRIFLSKDIEDPKTYLDFILPLLNNDVFNDNDLFIYEPDVIKKIVRTKLNSEIKEQIITRVSDQELLLIAKTFLECNMNTSLTATKLYMHRNTLINKLDRFKELTGYDLRQFVDAFIIYSIL